MRGSDASIPAPMFPLSTVLLPTQVLPLHIFEPRYRALANEVAAGVANEFGVVLIERGTEIGGQDQRATVGTFARVTEAGQFEDGRWLLVCVGTARFSIKAWLPDDPYPVALVDRLSERPLDTADQPSLWALRDEVRAVRRLGALLGEVDDDSDDVIALPDDPVTASWILCNYAPLGSFDRQQLLEIDEPADRLGKLADLVTGVREAYQFRLGA
jgi:hypothetical protein